MSSVAIDDAMLRVLFDQNGEACEGLFAATVMDAMCAWMYGADAGYYTMYLIVGISANVEVFNQIESTFSESLSSFLFSDSYVQEGIQLKKWETERTLEIAHMLSEAADHYNEAWSNRQPADDALYQKRSDFMLGFDRVYDIETGITYRAKLGWFDEYRANREDFANKNIELVPENGYTQYSMPISGDIIMK